MVINFENRYNFAMTTNLAQQFAFFISTSTKYHGYKSNSPAFLNYQIFKVVDLSDPGGAPNQNGSRLPRLPRSDGSQAIRESAFFTDQFTQLLDLRDGNNNQVSLQQAFATGLINEVWFVATQNSNSQDSPRELIEYKQRYNSNFQKLGSSYDSGAGNGGLDPGDNPPWFGHSFRIVFINGDRGLGCALHNYGHGFESFTTRGVVPYLQNLFADLGELNLDTKYGLSVSSLYALPYGTIVAQFTSPTSLFLPTLNVTINQFHATCGNAHFPPNGTSDYDYANTTQVLANCENWRGSNDPEPFTGATIPAVMNDYDNDNCGGNWQIWWRQNYPGLNNDKTDLQGRPMKNWWPFLFY